MPFPGGIKYDVPRIIRGQKMKRNHLIIVALVIFASFGIFTAIKQSQFANDQASDNESRIGELESQVQDLENRLR